VGFLGSGRSKEARDWRAKRGSVSVVDFKPLKYVPGCARVDRYSRSGSQAELRVYIRPTPAVKQTSDFLITNENIVRHQLHRITFSLLGIIPKAEVERLIFY